MDTQKILLKDLKDDFLKGDFKIQNDVTHAQLNSILRYMYPEGHIRAFGNSTLYWHSLTANGWKSGDMPSLALRVVRASNILKFLEAPASQAKPGDRVLVSDNGNDWLERTFVAYQHEHSSPVIVVFAAHEKNFESDTFSIIRYKMMKPVPAPGVVELTLEEISKKLNIPVGQLRIKE